jgi:hypothetical protein
MLGSRWTPVTADEARVQLRLAGDLLLNRVGYRLRDGIENQYARFPALARHVDTSLEHAPASLVEDRLRGGNDSGALVRNHEPMDTGRSTRHQSKMSVALRTRSVCRTRSRSE